MQPIFSAPRGATADGWTRHFHLYIPVADPKTWTRARNVLRRTVTFLSGDVWDFTFRERALRDQPASTEAPKFDSVSLFSGGLDSLTGAIDSLTAGRKVLLIGHYGGGTTSKFQENIYKELQRIYGESAVALRFQVLPPKLTRTDTDSPAEETQRTRSFLFFALGLAVADTINANTPLHVPENGLISLNVPMTGTVPEAPARGPLTHFM